MNLKLSQTTIANILFTIIGIVGAVFCLLIINEIVTLAHSDFLRIAVGAFTGSSTAGIIFYIIRRHLDHLPLLVMRGHVIICHLNFRTHLIVQALNRSKIKLVIIEPDPKNPYLEACRNLGLVVLTGSTANEEMLKKAGILNADYLLSFDEKDENNAEVALMAKKMVTRRAGKPLSCLIQIVNPDLFRILRKQSFAPRQDVLVKIELFNQYAAGARALLDNFPPFEEETGTSTLPIIIVGAGKLGENMITRIIFLWYLRHRHDAARISLYLVSLDAARVREKLLNQYPKIPSVCDFIPVTLDLDSASFRRGDLFSDPVFRNGFISYICLDDDSLGLYAALTMQQSGPEKNRKLIVRMDHNTSVAKLIATEDSSGGGRQEIFPVNVYELTANNRTILAGEEEILAQAIHEYYYRAEMAKGETPATNKLLVSWDRLAELTDNTDGVDGEAYRNSNRGQADIIWTKLSRIGCDIGPITDWDSPLDFSFTPDEIEYLARIEHERWMLEKTRAGGSYGPSRNERGKIFPTMIPYDQLSEREKQKDRDTIIRIPLLLSLIDFQVYRLKSEEDCSTGQTASP
jgi:voltage-gated potassium channel Kch